MVRQPTIHGRDEPNPDPDDRPIGPGRVDPRFDDELRPQSLDAVVGQRKVVERLRIMAADGNLGGHFQCVGRKFVTEWIAPLVSAAPDAVAAERGAARLR